MNELISVIINVYNGEKYISKCLESVINQTYKNLEILIINDGSTDNTLKICESYKDERIKIINQKNMGLSMSRNIGIDNSNGKYLYFVDSDDFIENDAIEYLYNLIKKYDVSIASCRPKEIYDYNIKKSNIKEKNSIVNNKEMIKKILLSKEQAGTIWNKLMKRELFDNIRFEERIVNDVVVTYKIFLEADKIAYGNVNKYYYFRHYDSIIGKNEVERLKDLYKAVLERYYNIKKVYPNLIENEICVDYIIVFLYLKRRKELEDFINEEDIFGVFKKCFSIKVLISKIRFGDKIKIILFRINPKFCEKIYWKYMDMKS